MTTTLRSTLLPLALLLLAGCPDGGPREDAPPDLRYGVDPCDRCAMIVNEERFAGAYVTAGGETRRFDDLGCLTALLAERGEVAREVWVHDHESRVWLRGRQAWYARLDGLITPMGTGIVAVGDQARARALAADGRGQALDAAAFLALGAGAFPR